MHASAAWACWLWRPLCQSQKLPLRTRAEPPHATRSGTPGTVLSACWARGEWNGSLEQIASRNPMENS
jgi:hypothetical protein